MGVGVPWHKILPIPRGWLSENILAARLGKDFSLDITFHRTNFSTSLSLTEEQVFALLNVVGAKARAGDLVGKRDYALLLLYITTGMRRNEVMSLRGKEVIVEEKRIIIRGRGKGGDYQGREVTDRRVRAALLDYRDC
jgi:integrase